VPKAAAAFQPRDKRFTADSDTIMEAVVKVCLTLTFVDYFATAVVWVTA
jgi:hypothetical protein